MDRHRKNAEYFASPEGQRMLQENLHDDMRRVTVVCPRNGCSKLVTRIERYHVNVAWELTPAAMPSWDLGCFDNGTHFHVFCEDEHESKLWGRELPKRLQAVVYPGDRTQPEDEG